MKTRVSLQTFFQVTRSFFGIFGWLVKEYVRELRAGWTKARSKIKEQGVQVSAAIHPTLNQWLDALSHWEKSVLLLYYQDGLDFATIAEKTGMNVREVAKIHQNLIYKMKNLVYDEVKSEEGAQETTGSVA